MQVQAIARTDVGRVRAHNEDNHRIVPELGLHVVCDGMGGHAAGEVASELACDAFVAHMRAAKPLIATYDGSQRANQALIDMLHAAVVGASKVVFDQASLGKGRHGMGTTLVALLLFGDKGLVVHVGDSRLYLLRDAQVHRLTTDHNFRSEVVKSGMMTEAEAARSPHSNVLTRAVGVAPSVSPDLLLFDVLPGDTFVLCSDGLHEYLDDPREFVHMCSGSDLDAVSDLLVTRALEGGGRDNITAVLVRALGQTERERERKHTVSRGFEALRDLELFRDLDMAELVRLYALLATEHFKSGACIVREGDSAGRLYILLEGGVEVARSGQAIATLGRGAHFGEMSLLNQRPRSATVIAVMPTSLLSMEPSQFQTLLAHEPRLASKVLLKLAQTLSLRLDDAYLARDQRMGRATLGLGEYPPPGERE